MSYLINRNPSGRFICLHALLKYLYNRFNVSHFKLNDFKYDASCQHNIHQTCKLLIKLPSIPFLICPYLKNPLSDAKCYLTQSIQEDTQKSKSVSDAFNALEGLNFIKRIADEGVITKDGINFITEDYYSPSTLAKIRNGVMQYGPFVGFLYELSKINTPEFERGTIRFGYPVTNEVVVQNNRNITLSTGSTSDTVTRTTSVLIVWAITAGFLLPVTLREPSDFSNWHIESLDYIKSKSWSARNFKIYIPQRFFDNKIHIKNPLSYNSMTKSTKALREREQELERMVTMKYEPIINNRRFAIVYGLATSSISNTSLNFDAYLEKLLKLPELFVVNKNGFETVMDTELSIANICGIPFERNKGMLIPKTSIDIELLKTGAPESVVKALNEILNSNT